MFNNETVKKFEVVVKLRGDNIYDIYLGKEWYCSHGSYVAAAQEVKQLMEEAFLEE